MFFCIRIFFCRAPPCNPFFRRALPCTPLKDFLKKVLENPKNFKRNGFSKFSVALLTTFSLQPSPIFPLRLPFGHPPLPKGEAFIISISFVGSPLGRAGAVRRLRGSPIPLTLTFAPRATSCSVWQDSIATRPKDTIPKRQRKNLKGVS